MSQITVQENNYLVNVLNSQNSVSTQETRNLVTVAEDVVVVSAIAAQGPPGLPGADADLSNVSVTAGDGLSGGGTLESNVTLAVDSTVVRTSGDQSIAGNKTFDSVLYVDSANSRVGINTLDPRIDLQIGEVGLGTYVLNTSTALPNQIADAWSANDFRSAKYQVQIYSNTANEHEISEIFLLHDDSNVYVTEYAIINQGTRLMQFNASIHNSTVRLLCTPTYAVNQVKVFRSVIST